MVSASTAGNLWRSLADVFSVIWPTYQGPVAQVIDAILLFLIVTMTIVEVSKKTNVPKTAAWGVGIALWLAVAVPLIASGRPLLSNAWVASIAFLIIAIVLTVLLKGGFSALTDRWGWQQWAIAGGLAVSAAGSLFHNILNTITAVTESERAVLSWTLAIIDIGFPFALLAVLIAGVTGFAWHKGRNNTDTVDTNTVKSLDRNYSDYISHEQEHLDEEQKHEEYLEELLEHERRVDDELREEKETNNKLEQLRDYLSTLESSAQDFAKTIKEYENWTQTNNTQLPTKYQQRLKEIARGWGERMSSVEELIKEVAVDEAGVAQTEAGEDRQAFQKEIRRYVKLDQQLTQQATQVTNLAQQLHRQAEQLLSLLQRPGGDNSQMNRRLRENPSFKRLQRLITRIAGNLNDKRERLMQLLSAAKKSMESIDKYAAHINELDKTLHETMQSANKSDQSLAEHARKASESIKTGISQAQTDPLNNAIKHLQEAKKLAQAAHLNIEKRARSQSLDVNYVKEAVEFLKKHHKAYQELSKELEQALSEEAELAATTKTIHDLFERILIFEHLKPTNTSKQEKEAKKQEIQQQLKAVYEETEEFFLPLKELQEAQELKDALLGSIQAVKKEADKYIEELAQDQEDVMQALEGK